MSDLKRNISIKTTIIAIAIVVLFFSFAVILSQKKTNPANINSAVTPVVNEPKTTPATINSEVAPSEVNPAEKAASSTDSIPLVTPEPPKIRYISGVIKEVKKTSIIINSGTPAKEEVEVDFDKTTKILIGEGVGKAAAISDLAVGWNVAVFLPESKDNNIAQMIQLVVENK